ncbi:MAG: endo alpha-1,4 polygalactosaminidase [Bacteroidota bacterium]
MKVFRILFVLTLLFSCSKEKRSNNAGEKMQDFVIDISAYAKGINSNFAIIPQNGEELLYRFLNDGEGFDERFISAIDGYGIEELFYNGGFSADNYRLNLLLPAREKIPILVSDYTSNQNNFDSSFVYNTDAGFVPFPRTSDNYDYKFIPTYVHNENANNITKVSEAKNYLYLISTENSTTKQSFLDSIKETNFDLIIIDAFFGDDLFTNAEITSLKTKKNGGKRMVISYISIGSAEKYRYYWQEDWKLHKPRFLEKEYTGYPDEIWVKYWKKDWEEIIYGNENSYMKKILDAGFDGAYLDNVEAFYFLYFD